MCHSLNDALRRHWDGGESRRQYNCGQSDGWVEGKIVDCVCCLVQQYREPNSMEIGYRSKTERG